MQYELFLDYDDGYLFEDVKKEVLKLKQKYGLNYRIYLSSRKKIVYDLYSYHYHVILKGNLTRKAVLDLLKDTSVDDEFVRCAYLYPFQVLRISEKQGQKPLLLESDY